MKLKRIGFFRESHGNISDPSIMAFISDIPQEDEDKLTSYLESGNLLIASPGIAIDVLNERKIAGSSHILTDGKWAWPEELAYYVQNYHVRLPEQFVSFAAANDWKVPQNIDIDKLNL